MARNCKFFVFIERHFYKKLSKLNFFSELSLMLYQLHILIFHSYVCYGASESVKSHQTTKLQMPLLEFSRHEVSGWFCDQLWLTWSSKENLWYFARFICRWLYQTYTILSNVSIFDVWIIVSLRYEGCFARLSTICMIEKTWKLSMGKCYF